ncbi:MAG: ATP synthase F1 subunit delta [Clostridia bacterium]|nr:ATP synthase F1 subunit delta [Clostridia bacterium]
MINAAEYGKALFLLSEERGTTESVLADARIARAVLLENPKYSKLADTPALSKDEKTALIAEAFASLDPDLVSLLKILCEKHSVCEFCKVADAYFALYDESRGIERVEAITAVPMTAAQIDAMKAKLERLTGKQIIITNKTDRAILGGVKLRYAGIQLDGSLKKRLDTLESSLKSIII